MSAHPLSLASLHKQARLLLWPTIANSTVQFVGASWSSVFQALLDWARRDRLSSHLAYSGVLFVVASLVLFSPLAKRKHFVVYAMLIGHVLGWSFKDSVTESWHEVCPDNAGAALALSLVVFVIGVVVMTSTTHLRRGVGRSDVDHVAGEVETDGFGLAAGFAFHRTINAIVTSHFACTDEDEPLPADRQYLGLVTVVVSVALGTVLTLRLERRVGSRKTSSHLLQSMVQLWLVVWVMAVGFAINLAFQSLIEHGEERLLLTLVYAVVATPLSFLRMCVHASLAQRHVNGQGSDALVEPLGDKSAERRRRASLRRSVMMVRGTALVIGFAWEEFADKAIDDITRDTENGVAFATKLGLALATTLVFVGALIRSGTHRHAGVVFDPSAQSSGHGNGHEHAHGLDHDHSERGRSALRLDEALSDTTLVEALADIALQEDEEPQEAPREASRIARGSSL